MDDIFEDFTDEELKISLVTANRDMEIAYNEHKAAVEYKNMLEEEIKRREKL